MVGLWFYRFMFIVGDLWVEKLADLAWVMVLYIKAAPYGWQCRCVKRTACIVVSTLCALL
jgi:hypothetical protein